MVEKTCPNCKTILTETTGYRGLLGDELIESWTCLECGYYDDHITGILDDDELENIKEMIDNKVD